MRLTYKRLYNWHVVKDSDSWLTAQWEVDKPISIEDVSPRGADSETTQKFMRHAAVMADIAGN